MRFPLSACFALIAGGVAIAAPAAAQEADVPPNIACMRDATDAENAAYISFYTDHFDYQPGGPIPDPTEALSNALASHLYRCMAELDWDDATMSAAFGAQTGYLVEMGIVNSMPVSTPSRLEVQEMLNRISMRDLRILSGELQADGVERAQAMQAMTGGFVVSMEEGAIATIENYAPPLAKARLIRIEGLHRLREEGNVE
ncbi:hypothetical protein [Croceicoccus gelatinilyticus]|uniref:hypothetical protein n=1 Tax=Croceicoccus gelatinilyticus TaxID=2835536 RepID=UPI001BCE2B6C|nr:hypothetical protein [Croceicoccus gelatinilyticus]MBS7670514.1 hypothetical protein [Croceicoccus gelatinilyticus]